MKDIFRLVLSGAGALFLLFGFSACNDFNELGLELLPGTDLINVKNIEIKDSINVYANSESGIVTSKSAYNLLGSFNDPLFGSTNASFAAQFRITSFPDYGSNPEADSVFLYLYYTGVYGDTLTEQLINVYELESSLDEDAEYKQDIDLKSMASSQLIGQLTYNPKVELDSTYGDTLYQLLKIPLDLSLGQKFLDADSLDKVSNDAFLQYFKGLYIESEPVTGETGALITLHASATSAFQGSALVLYYNNDENKDLEVEEQDTLSRAFIITENSARVTAISHDYSSAPFVNDIDQHVKQEDNIFLQPTGGMKSFIWIGDLSGWSDSVNIAINKAELVFQVDTVLSDLEHYPPPASLLLTYVTVDGEENYPEDIFGPYYDGTLQDDYTYHFNITQHIQRIIDYQNSADSSNYVGNQGFYLTTGQLADSPKRVVLEGTKGNSGVKFIITYSQYLK